MNEEDIKKNGENKSMQDIDKLRFFRDSFEKKLANPPKGYTTEMIGKMIDDCNEEIKRWSKIAKDIPTIKKDLRDLQTEHLLLIAQKGIDNGFNYDKEIEKIKVHMPSFDIKYYEEKSLIPITKTGDKPPEDEPTEKQDKFQTVNMDRYSTGVHIVVPAKINEKYIDENLFPGKVIPKNLSVEQNRALEKAWGLTNRDVRKAEKEEKGETGVFKQIIERLTKKDGKLTGGQKEKPSFRERITNLFTKNKKEVPKVEPVATK